MTGQSEWGGEGRRRAVRHADGHPGGGGALTAAAGVDPDEALDALSAAVDMLARVGTFRLSHPTPRP